MVSKLILLNIVRRNSQKNLPCGTDAFQRIRNNYRTEDAIVSFENNSSSQGYTCTTVELLSSRRKLADKLLQDHEVALHQIAKHGET